MIDQYVMTIETPDVATTVANKDTSPATEGRMDHHLEEERIKGPGQARLNDITVETIKDDFDHAGRVGSDRRRPKKHFGRPAAGCSREELHSTISINKPGRSPTLGTFKELNLNMRRCSRFEGAFVRVETTLSTPAWNY